MKTPGNRLTCPPVIAVKRTGGAASVLETGGQCDRVLRYPSMFLFSTGRSRVLRPSCSYALSVQPPVYCGYRHRHKRIRRRSAPLRSLTRSTFRGVSSGTTPHSAILDSRLHRLNPWGSVLNMAFYPRGVGDSPCTPQAFARTRTLQHRSPVEGPDRRAVGTEHPSQTSDGRAEICPAEFSACTEPGGSSVCLSSLCSCRAHIRYFEYPSSGCSFEDYIHRMCVCCGPIFWLNCVRYGPDKPHNAIQNMSLVVQ